MLADAGPDVLAIETITRLAEIEALVAELDGVGVPAWISLTVSDGALRTGESLRRRLRDRGAVAEVVAVGVNCCDAREVSGALAIAREVGDLPTARLPEQRRDLGRRAPRLDRRPRSLPDELVRDWAADGDGADRRLLPHRTGRHRAIARIVAAGAPR